MLYSKATIPSDSSLCPLWDTSTPLNHLPMPEGKGQINCTEFRFEMPELSVWPQHALSGLDQMYPKKATSQRSGYSVAAVQCS